VFPQNGNGPVVEEKSKEDKKVTKTLGKKSNAARNQRRREARAKKLIREDVRELLGLDAPNSVKKKNSKPKAQNLEEEGIVAKVKLSHILPKDDVNDAKNSSN